jgi:hypothetical protein
MLAENYGFIFWGLIVAATVGVVIVAVSVNAANRPKPQRVQGQPGQPGTNVRPMTAVIVIAVVAVGIPAFLLRSVSSGGGTSTDTTYQGAVAAEPAVDPGSSGDGGGRGTTTGQSADALAENACWAFVPAANDYLHGLMTASEFRDKMAGVYDSARYSETPGVAKWSSATLRDLTQGSSPERLATHLYALLDACQAAGAVPEA